MLVLTREVGEVVIIVDRDTGEKIKIILTRIKEREARVGFECDKTKYNIYRQELGEK